MPKQPSEVSLIEYLANPEHWSNPAYQGMWRKSVPLNPEEVSKYESGILVAPVLGRYVFYPGVDEHSPAPEMQKAMGNSRVLLAHELQELIDEGWVID